jgi:predicted transcriptional regulator
MYTSHMVHTFCILRHNVCFTYGTNVQSIHYVEACRTCVPYVKFTLCRDIQNVCTICEAYIMSRQTERVYHMWSIHYVEAYRTFVPYVKHTLCRDIQNVCTICEVYIMSKHTERLYHMWSIHYVEVYRTFVPYVKHTLCRQTFCILRHNVYSTYGTNVQYAST